MASVRKVGRYRRPAAAAIVAASLLLFPAAARADVKVERKPVHVETKTYDPKDPPKDVRGLGEKEAGLTMSEFDCQIALSVAPGDSHPVRGGKCQEALVVRSVKVMIELRITIWLPDNANDKLKAHEEGHRQMAETLYNDRAEKAARAAGTLVDGRRFLAEAGDCGQIDKAVNQTLDEINKKVYDSYLSQTADASARAGDIYDEITAHGTNRIDEKTATVQAFAKLAEEAKKAAGGTTRPARRPAPGENAPPVREVLPK